MCLISTSHSGSWPALRLWAWNSGNGSEETRKEHVCSEKGKGEEEVKGRGRETKEINGSSCAVCKVTFPHNPKSLENFTKTHEMFAVSRFLVKSRDPELGIQGDVSRTEKDSRNGEPTVNLLRF